MQLRHRACYDFRMISMLRICAAAVEKRNHAKILYIFFYSAAFQMSLKTHFRQKKKKEGELVLEGVVISGEVVGVCLAIYQSAVRKHLC